VSHEIRLFQPVTDVFPVHAASLNYRDILITRGRYPFGQAFPVVPGSDGAGVVEAIGRHVTRFKKGDKVVTLFNQGHLAGSLDAQTLVSKAVRLCLTNQRYPSLTQLENPFSHNVSNL
jgi:NADPH:quinone reductase-like Zn-dependent oxidoreductase